MSDIIASAVPIEHPEQTGPLDPHEINHKMASDIAYWSKAPSASPANSFTRLSAFTAQTSAKSVQPFTLTSPVRSAQPSRSPLPALRGGWIGVKCIVVEHYINNYRDLVALPLIACERLLRSNAANALQILIEHSCQVRRQPRALRVGLRSQRSL